jgi:hypothetical protein
MRRQLSTGVNVKTYSRVELLLADEPLRRTPPTEAEVRDALARCTAELDKDAQPYFANGWKAGDFDFRLVDTTDEVVLRGNLIIERAD